MLTPAFTPSVHTVCSHRPFTPSVHTVCSHLLFTPSIHTFLGWQELTTLPYYDDGLCDASSPLHNAEHCDLCEERMMRVTLALAVTAVVLEHILICVKLLVPPPPPALF